ncbi:hypothetical protein SNOG_10272 [Parastagonospora nodorum SN15]|uniref:Uncharacterized protein n=1 Tax=Phaeosphaeria nodorum (strain SN15 / ATCC MYA-4574 / FGSC 10173) TaxID=321614 RepID=Q0UD92_PHANO|nr:hypothetical protein SNOG_10272 [Parastagonospora nodorum SN15]EAT82607.1 hypothetical protein SNOG_10272 [Parastagonospora nodorum SN15]
MSQRRDRLRWVGSREEVGVSGLYAEAERAAGRRESEQKWSRKCPEAWWLPALALEALTLPLQTLQLKRDSCLDDRPELHSITRQEGFAYFNAGEMPDAYLPSGRPPAVTSSW